MILSIKKTHPRLLIRRVWGLLEAAEDNEMSDRFFS